MATRKMKAVKRVGNKDFLFTTAAFVLLFAAALSFAVYLRATAPPEDGSYLPGEQEITPEIELLQEYVRLETVAGREIEGARFLIDYLAQHGIDAELIVSGEGRGNVYARLRGKRPGEGLLLLHHIDVKPADPGKWTRPPFAAEVFQNRLYGRGVLDMKAIGITQLLAFVEAAQLGEPLERDLVFLAVADEEQGSMLGMRWLLENRKDIFEDVQYALNEGGVTEMMRDRIAYFAIETGGRQIREFRLSADEAESFEELEERWQDLKFAVEIETLLPEVEDYFRRIAPFRRHFGPLLEDIRATSEAGKLGQLHPSYLVLLQNNIALSPVSERDDGRFQRRAVLWYLPGIDPQPLTNRILADASELGVEAVIAPNSSPPIVGFSSTEDPFFDLFEQKVHEVYGDDVVVGPMVGNKGLTDCRFLRAEGIDCYGIWPFPVTVNDSTGIHGIDERLRLDWFISGIRLMKGVVREWVSD